NRNLKTLLSIGGWNFGTQKFSTMVSKSENRQIFIKSVIRLLRGYGFDDLFSHRYLDFFNVMTYDFVGSGNIVTGENSPLYPLPNNKHYTNLYFNVNFTMNYWRIQGAPAEKLNIGFPTYGHTFRLTTSDHGIGAPSGGPGPAGKYTRSTGSLAYYEICTLLKSGTSIWNAPQVVPYGYKGDTWIGYDNVKSFRDKAEWLTKNNFGGAMVWTLAMDDFSGSFCNQGPYPLINALHTGLGISSACVPSKTTLKPAVPVTQPPGSGFCANKSNGFYADPKDKTKFYQCDDGVTYLKNCIPGSRQEQTFETLTQTRSTAPQYLQSFRHLTGKHRESGTN
ncbi:hypothetical protein scyTo_0013070, partial [Scyliorhinus torazame]|nr:hypothetical protein [Scyliorhinus torazame]